jgi:hypothetical protein
VGIPLALYLFALVARLLVAVMYPDAAYPDSFYYVDVARQLAAGHGFNVDVVWIFAEVGGGIPANPTLPIPSNAHWMPLASLVQVPFIWILGPTAMASALPFAFVGALAAPIAWAIGRDAGAPAWVSVGAGILTAVPALSFVFMAQPDNFSLYQPLVAGSLWLGGRALAGRPHAGRDLALAGLLAGIATLSRNDGLLVLAVLIAAFIWDRLHRRRIPFAAGLGSIALFLVVMVPWWIRQLLTFGSLSPSTASGKVLFIRDIGEWNSITTPATLDHLLGMGIVPLLLTRIGGLVASLFIFTVLICAFVLAPFMAIGGWARRRDALFGPYLLYAIVLFAFSALISAVHVPGGTFIHSAVALAPAGYVLALEGIVIAAAWAAERRPGWEPTQAARTFIAAGVGFCVLAGLVGSLAVHGSWADKAARMQSVDVALDLAGARQTDRVMATDAAGYRYWTGHPAVVLVNDPLATVQAVGDAYDVRWLILEPSDTVPAVTALLSGGPRPPWLGPPVLEHDDVVVFPMCRTTGNDPRCSQ